jgi:sugar-specific transcriptional regulator TrmB
MHVVNSKESEVVDMLKDFGLCGYEARMYFTLLTIGEAKALDITRKASVPHSKAYTVLEDLMAKSFVELSRAERPKLYRAKVLEEVTDLTVRQKQRQIQALEKKHRKLAQILQSIAPVHQKYSGLRLFSPSYKRR